jgi:hypothetical protein
MHKWCVNFILQQSCTGGGAAVKRWSAVKKDDGKAARARDFGDQRTGYAGPHYHNVRFARRFQELRSDTRSAKRGP